MCSGWCPTALSQRFLVKLPLATPPAVVSELRYDPEMAQNNAVGNTNPNLGGDELFGFENLSEQQRLDATLGLLNPSEQRLADRGQGAGSANSGLRVSGLNPAPAGV